jgi:poly-gamma-glutamate capsule biosynthesis protein CapA/YwtB (metallophosphatase superfamily)
MGVWANQVSSCILHPASRVLRLASCILLVALFLPGEPVSPALTLILAGDVMLGRGVAQALGGEWEAAFAGVRSWLAGDESGATDRVLTFANLESPLTAAPQVRGGHDLRAPPAAVAALRAAGLDAVSLANNHALDAGQAGLHETVRTLYMAGIVPWMDGASAAQDGEAAGGRTGALTYEGLAFDDSIVPLDLEAAGLAVAAAVRRSDVVIVSVHWGGEYQAVPSARQQAIARALAEAGADVIAGHGPHVLQRVEWVEETLVAYSLGNFLFDQPYPEDCRWGAILHVTLRGGRAVAVEAFPTVAERGRVRPADPDTAAAICSRLGGNPYPCAAKEFER